MNELDILLKIIGVILGGYVIFQCLLGATGNLPYQKLHKKIMEAADKKDWKTFDKLKEEYISMIDEHSESF